MKKLVLLFVSFLLLGISTEVLGQSLNVSGTITSSKDGETLISASVSEKGTQNGVITDLDGNYSISVSSAQAVLVVDYMGMKQQEISVNGRSVIDVKMEPAYAVMEEVVVVGYGVRKKGTIAGSVSVVKADRMENTVTPSFEQALQGQTPGLTVLANSGEPSDPASFQIRGVNSINSGTQPLFILDGVPISSSDFSSINPNDIESVSVLKDASSTSIYGARAANGVIVITTKRGKVGEKGNISVRGQYGFSSLAYGKWNQMNTTERLNYEEEIGLRTPGTYDRASLEKINVDWRDAVYNNFAPFSNYELSASGANERFNYFVSGAYYGQTGIAIGSSFDRFNVRANLEAKVNSWFKIGTNTALSYEDIKQADQGEYTTVTPISASRFMLPYWNPYKEDGTIASVKDGTWLGTNQNPLEWADNNPTQGNKLKIFSNINFELTPVKNLTIRSVVGIDFVDYTNNTKSKSDYVPNFGIGTVGSSFERSMNITWSNTATYLLNINQKHDFNFMLGQELIDNNYNAFSVASRGQNNDKLLNLSSGTNAISWGDNFNSYSYMSVFARAEYNFDRKYYADLSIRRDASSRFGKNNRWANFWSLGLMWNALAEDFLKDYSWLTNAQVSFSVGTSGNSSIPAYDHLALVSGGPKYDGMPGISPYTKGNENLTWEKLLTTNLAIKLGFLNKLNVSLEFYNKNTSDMLMEVPISYVTGFKYKWENIGKMVNRGLELDLNYDIIRTRDYGINVYTNFSYNLNKITELYGGKDEYELANTGMLLKVGHSVGEFYMNRYYGVNPANGDALWLDKNGEITNEYDENDKVLIGKSYIAPWQGGFGLNANYKGITLGATFSWVAGRYMSNNDRYFDESNGTFSAYNQSNKLLYDRWKQPGDVTSIPRHGVAMQMDSHLLEDASFLRLKNVSIGYNFSPNMLKKTKVIERLRLYIQGQNLFTLTPFTGMDPESNTNVYQATYPLSRQYSLGLEIGF